MGIKFFVALRKSPTETVKMLEDTDDISKMSRAFVYKLRRRFSCGRDSIFDDERPGRRTIICQDLVE